MIFYTLLTIELLLLLWLFSCNASLVALFSFLVFGLLLEFTTNYSFFATIYNNPLYTLIFLFVYFIIGIFWSLFKWGILVYDNKLMYKKILNNFYDKINLDKDQELNEEQEKNWQEYFNVNKFYNPFFDNGFNSKYYMKPPITKRPDITLYKDDILSWMVFWPFSFIHTFLSDLIYKFYNKLCEYIYDSLKFIFNYITDLINK